MQSQKALQDYYNLRAQEYEEIYLRPDPVRQKELAEIAADMKTLLSGRRVLEIACGTGFWTVIAAKSASRIFAIDISNEMLAVAKAKGLLKNVTFCTCDAYSLDSINGKFDAGLANFWLSHVPKKKLGEFLDRFHKELTSGAVVFMADNVFVAGVGGELSSEVGCEDTFKLRQLSEGSIYKVLKNYYDAGQLREIFGPLSSELKIRMGDCFWWLSYSVP